MNTKMSNISHVCRSCSSCFLQAAIGGAGTGSITTLHQTGFLSSRSQASVTETAVSKPESAQRFIWTVEQLISIRSTSLPGACIQVPWPRPHQRPVRNIHFPGQAQYSNICVGGGPSQLLQGGRLRGAKHGNNKWKNKFNFNWPKNLSMH